MNNEENEMENENGMYSSVKNCEKVLKNLDIILD